MITNRRFDNSTSAAIAEAFKLQRTLGFEPAFLMLRARGVDAKLARELLDQRSERRKTTTETLEERPEQSARML